MSPRARRIATGTLGIAVGLAALALALFRLEWHGGPALVPRVSPADLAAALFPHTRPAWLAAYLLVNGSTMLLRALQLRAIAHRSDGTRPPLGACARAVAISILAHNLLPARLGEAARALVLRREGDVPLARGAGALLVGRALDLLALLLTACALPIALGLTAARIPSLRAVAIAGSALAAALALAIAALWLARDHIAKIIDKLSTSAGAAAGDFGHGLAAIADPRRFIEASAWSLAVPVLLAAGNACALRALDIDAPAGTAFALTGIVTLGVAVPAAPSSLGTYHALCLVTLAALGVATAPALGFALVTHATSTLLGCTLGALALSAARLRAPTPASP